MIHSVSVKEIAVLPLMSLGSCIGTSEISTYLHPLMTGYMHRCNIDVITVGITDSLLKEWTLNCFSLFEGRLLSTVLPSLG